MHAIIGALAATAGLIAFGRVLRNRFDEGFWRALESLTYQLFLPALLVRELSRADFAGMPVVALVVVLAGSLLLGAALTLAVRPLLARGDGPGFTSTFQATVRFNTFVGLFVAQAVYGPAGLALAAVASGILVPLANLTSTAVLVRWGVTDGPRESMARSLATNPLVIACAVGLGANGVSLAWPALGEQPAVAAVLDTIGRLVGMLGQAALPVGLLCVGAGLTSFATAPGRGRFVVAAAVMRFAVMPALTVGLCLATGLTGPAAGVAVLYQCLPTASSAYILARRLGGDAPLMATIIAQQTVLACAVLPVWILAATHL